MTVGQFTVKPIPGPKYTTKQSKYQYAPKVNFRQIMYANTNSGKTTNIISQILDLYRDVFERIFIFSHSIDTDSAWEPVKSYMESKEWNLKECLFSEYSDLALEKILKTQEGIIKYQKSKGETQLYSILVIFDDMMTSRQAMRGRLIDVIYSRGRHLGISVITSLQSVRKVSTVVRQNSEHILTWRLRSASDLDSLLEENSAIVDLDTLQEMYWKAVRKPYGYLWIDKSTNDEDEMFHPNGLGTPPEKIT